MFRRSRQGLIRSFSEDGSFPVAATGRRWLRKLHCHHQDNNNHDDSLPFFPVIQEHGVYQQQQDDDAIETSWDSSDSSTHGLPRGSSGTNLHRLDSVEEEEEEDSDYSSEYMDDDSSSSSLPFGESSSSLPSKSLEEEEEQQQREYRIGIRPFSIPGGGTRDIEEDDDELEELFYVERSALYEPNFSNIIVPDDMPYDEGMEDAAQEENVSEDSDRNVGLEKEPIKSEDQAVIINDDDDDDDGDDVRDRGNAALDQQTDDHDRPAEQKEENKSSHEKNSDDASDHDQYLSAYPSDQAVDTPVNSTQSETSLANSAALVDGIRQDQQHQQQPREYETRDANLSSDSETNVEETDGLGTRSVGTSVDYHSVSVMAVGSEETRESSKQQTSRSLTELIDMFESKYVMEAASSSEDGPGGSEHRQDSVSQAETLSSFSSTACIAAVPPSPSSRTRKGFFWRSHPGGSTESSNKSEVRELPAGTTTDGYMLDTSVSTEEDANEYKGHQGRERPQTMQSSSQDRRLAAGYRRAFGYQVSAEGRIVYKAPWMDCSGAGTE